LKIVATFLLPKKLLIILLVFGKKKLWTFFYKLSLINVKITSGCSLPILLQKTYYKH
jgi:hypothetical protein